MISEHSWTVVANEGRSGMWRHWRWLDGHDSGLRILAEQDEILLMHRWNGKGWDLVARMPGPIWQRMAKRRRNGR